MLETKLSEAVERGDLDAVRSLLDAGANVRYGRPGGYSVLVDVMYGRSIADDDQLIPLLRLLIDRGADLDNVTDHGESALSVSSVCF
jgi:ankyrin repeat protein